MAGPDQRQERLRRREHPDDVHLELQPELLEWEELQRSRDDDTGVIDEPGQTVRCDGPNGVGCGGKGGGLGDVEQERRQALGGLIAERGSVLLGAYASEDVVPEVVEMERGGFPDPLRRAGDDHGPRGALSHWAVRRLAGWRQSPSVHRQG